MLIHPGEVCNAMDSPVSKAVSQMVQGNRKFRATYIYHKALPLGGLVYKSHTELVNSKVYLNKLYD